MLIIQKKVNKNNTANVLLQQMDHPYMRFMVRRLAAVKKRRCYIEIFWLIIEHKVAYTVNMYGVLFNLSSLPDELVRHINEIIKRCEERQKQQVAMCV